MIINGINQETCIQCLQCIQTCPSALFSSCDAAGKVEVRFNDPFTNCILCGHCIAVCPTNAIDFSQSEQSQELPANWSQERPSYKNLKIFLQNKRSIRRYSKDSVTKQEIDAILEVIRYSPSASNARKWQFLVITEPKKIATLSKEIVKTIKLTRKLVKNPIIRNCFIFGETRKEVKQPGFFPSLNRIITSAENGLDPIFFNAPCLIILHSPKYGNLASCDSGIAVTYGMLAAEAKGIGSCWIGIAQEAMQRLPNLRKKFGLKRSQIPWGCFVLGKPLSNYKRLPPRDPVEVKWQ